MKRSDFLKYWHLYGTLFSIIGAVVSYLAYVNGNKGEIPLWIAWILLILFVVLSIGWTIDTFLVYVDEVEDGVPPGGHYNQPYQSSITFGSYGYVLVILFLGFKIDPEKFVIFCLPLIPISCGIILGTYAAARIYLTRKGYHLNRFITIFEIILSIILILPIIIPIFFIIKPWLLI